MNWSRTLGFVSTQLTTAILIQLWCSMVHHRFRYFHPSGWGKGLSNIYWEYAWGYTTVAALMSILVVLLHWKGRPHLYEIVVRLGYWLLIVWAGFALIAMEIPFTPSVNLRGEQY